MGFKPSDELVCLWLMVVIAMLILKSEGLPISWFWALAPLWAPFALVAVLVAIIVSVTVIRGIAEHIRR